MTFEFKIRCASGVLGQGSRSDFLACLLLARDSFYSLEKSFPHSFLRLHIFYPNRHRVPAADIAAGYRALDASAPGTEQGCPVGPSVAQQVLFRAAMAAKAPARSGARTAAFGAMGGRCDDELPAAVFGQAGVVAPPDSLMDETLSIFGLVELRR